MKTTITCCCCKTHNINTATDTKHNIIFVYNSTIYYSVRIGQLADDDEISSAKIVKPQITSCLMTL